MIELGAEASLVSIVCHEKTEDFALGIVKRVYL